MGILKEIIEEYLKTPETDYAYILNGIWGSGKTYYIKNELLNDNDLIKKHKALYFSLNGEKSIEKVLKTINYNLLTDGMVGNEFETLISEGFDFLDEIDTGKSNTLIKAINAFKDKGVNFAVSKKKLDDYFLIIDDLERVSKSLNITDLLGQLYAKVIERGAKVLFISDETKIKCSKYEEQKEKYIRRTINFKNDNLKLFNSLLRERNLDKEDSLRKTFSYIVEEIVGEINFRTIIFALDIYKRLSIEVASIDYELFDLDLYFYSILVYCLELKSGNIPRGEESEVSSITHHYSMMNILNRTGNTEDDWKISFFNKYNRIEYRFYLPPVIVDYINTGYLDIEKLIQELKVVKTDESYRIFQAITYFEDLEMDELLIRIERLKELLEEGKYEYRDFPSIYEVLQNINKELSIDVGLKKFETIMQEIIEESQEEIKKYANETINKEFPQNEENIIGQTIEAYRREFVKEYRNIDFCDLIDTLRNDDLEKFKVKFSKYRYDDFFALIDEYNLYDEFKSLKNSSMNILSIILNEKILQLSNANQVYKNIIPILERIKMILKDELQSCQDDNLKEYVINNLINRFDEAIHHISE